MTATRSPLKLMLALAVAWIAGTAAVSAAPPPPPGAWNNVGTLTCDVGPGIGFIITSSKQVACTFRDNYGPPQYYNGAIRKFGLDLGFTGKSVIVWGVFAKTVGYPHGALAGGYGGVSAEASVVLGVGANALLGGSNRSFALQPLSVQAQVGLNLAVGVTSLELYPAN